MPPHPSFLPRLSRTELKPIVQMTLALWVGTSLFWGVPDLLSGGRIPLRVGLAIVFDIAVGLILCGIFLVTTLWLRGRPMPVRRVGVGLLAASLAVAHAYIDAEVMVWLNSLSGFRGSPLITIFSSILIDYVLIYVLFAAAVSLLLTQFELRKRDQRLARAELTAQQAQLAALRLQLNPHFLFNSLNALSSLVVTAENARAERMISLITSFLRSSLLANPREEVTVADELASISDYLEIELVRFEDRLTVEFHCPSQLSDALMPSHVLQPIVENAIKHGVGKLRIPPGTQSGKVFRMKGKGIKDFQGYHQGDQHVRVTVETPTRLTAKQKELLKEFAAVGGEVTTLNHGLQRWNHSYFSSSQARRTACAVAWCNRSR